MSILPQPEKQLRSPAQMQQLFWLCWAAYFVAYLGRLNYTATMPQMIADGVLSKAQAGTIGTGFFIVYAAGQLLGGALGDKLPPRWFLFTGLALSGLCNIFIGLTRAFGLMLVIWCVNGLAQSFVWSPLIRIICTRLERGPSLRACVNIQTTIPAGTLAAYGFSAWMAARGMWQGVFLTSGVLLCGFAFVWLFGIGRLERRAEAEGVVPEPSLAQPQKAPAKGGFWALFSHNRLLLLCLIVMLQGALKDGVTSWAPVYLVESFNLGTSSAILSTMLIPLLGMGGAYLSSMLSKKMGGSELLPSAFLFGASFAGLLAMYLVQGTGAALSLTLMATSTTAMMGVNTLLISLFPTRFRSMGRVATVSGVLNFSAYAGSAISNFGIGALAASMGWGFTIFTWCCLAGLGGLLCLLACRVTAPRLPEN